MRMVWNILIWQDIGLDSLEESKRIRELHVGLGLCLGLGVSIQEYDSLEERQRVRQLEVGLDCVQVKIGYRITIAYRRDGWLGNFMQDEDYYQGLRYKITIAVPGKRHRIRLDCIQVNGLGCRITISQRRDGGLLNFMWGLGLCLG